MQNVRTQHNAIILVLCFLLDFQLRLTVSWLASSLVVLMRKNTTLLWAPSKVGDHELFPVLLVDKPETLSCC